MKEITDPPNIPGIRNQVCGLNCSKPNVFIKLQKFQQKAKSIRLYTLQNEDILTKQSVFLVEVFIELLVAYLIIIYLQVIDSYIQHKNATEPI
jgi:hypothetical protein